MEMYFWSNPTKFRVRAEIKDKNRVVFQDTSLIVTCAAGADPMPEALNFRILAATRAADCKKVNHEVWGIEDAGPAGNGRRIKLTFKGKDFTQQHLKQVEWNNRDYADDPSLTLYQTLIRQGRIGILIELAGRQDPGRVDNLMLDLDYGPVADC